MNILQRIFELRTLRNWSEYRLSEEARLPQSTINAWYKKNNNPTFEPLEKICKAFGITLSQFFEESHDSPIVLLPEQAEMLQRWTALNDAQKQAIYSMIKAFNAEYPRFAEIFLPQSRIKPCFPLKNGE